MACLQRIELIQMYAVGCEISLIAFLFRKVCDCTLRRPSRHARAKVGAYFITTALKVCSERLNGLVRNRGLADGNAALCLRIFNGAVQRYVCSNRSGHWCWNPGEGF